MKTVAGMKVGDRFGMLTLVSTEVACWRNKYKCKFECSCGNVKVLACARVKRGTVKSCGCARTDVNIKHGAIGTRPYTIWEHSRKDGKTNVDFCRFMEIWPSIVNDGYRMTDLGPLPKEMARGVSSGGCAIYPFKYYCTFEYGRIGEGAASLKTGMSKSSLNHYAKQHPEIYAAGLQARAEREAASKPAPPSLPVNTSVDF